jgi:hypothetical protein
MTSSPSPRFGLDRRTFLLGAAAAGVAAACGSSGGDGDAVADGSYSVVQRYPSDVFVPGEIRLPFSLADAAEFITDGPDELGGQIVDIDGRAIGERITAVRRDITPAPYYAFRTTVDTPGVYGIRIDGGPEEGANFQVMERDQVTIPRPGDTLPGFDTPTVDDPAGVDPICTREPPCPFHEVTLTEALASGKAVAYFVGTPAFCQTGSCTPALETMVGVQSEYADDYVFVHAEVWTDLTATEVAPAVDALGIAFEPTLFITDADGVVVERLDGLWDATELRERLDAALV